MLLYKHQWNTRWAFTWKHDILTRENNLLFSHVNRSPLLWLHNKLSLSLWNWNVLVFHWCLYNKQHYMVAWRYEISTLVLKIISLVCCTHLWNIFEHSKRNFVSPCSHVISSIYVMKTLLPIIFISCILTFFFIFWVNFGAVLT